MIDLSKQTVKLYEKCPACVPESPPDTCLHCGGEGMIGRYVPVADILKASEDVLKAAVLQALRDGKPITSQCPSCKGVGIANYSTVEHPTACHTCAGTGRLTP